MLKNEKNSSSGKKYGTVTYNLYKNLLQQFSTRIILSNLGPACLVFEQRAEGAEGDW